MQHKANTLVSFVVGFVLILAIGCGDDTEPSNNTTANNVTTPDAGDDMGDDMGDAIDMGDATDMDEAAPTWENSIAAIFEANCVQCHAWAADYDLVLNDTSSLRDRTAAGHGRINNDEQQTILEWIDNGTPRE